MHTCIHNAKSLVYKIYKHINSFFLYIYLLIMHVRGLVGWLVSLLQDTIAHANKIYYLFSMFYFLRSYVLKRRRSKNQDDTHICKTCSILDYICLFHLLTSLEEKHDCCCFPFADGWNKISGWKSLLFMSLCRLWIASTVKTLTDWINCFVFCCFSGSAEQIT